MIWHERMFRYSTVVDAEMMDIKTIRVLWFDTCCHI